MKMSSADKVTLLGILVIILFFAILFGAVLAFVFGKILLCEILVGAMGLYFLVALFFGMIFLT